MADFAAREGLGIEDAARRRDPSRAAGRNLLQQGQDLQADRIVLRDTGGELAVSAWDGAGRLAVENGSRTQPCSPPAPRR